MASADKIHLIAACSAAVDSGEKLAPNARLWLARASLRCDPKGRTQYGANRYSMDTGDTINNGNDAIDQLLALGLIAHDYDDNGAECWRLMHYEFGAKPRKVGGYGSDRESPKDSLPPQYGRPVSAVVDPPTGNQDFVAPKWSDIAGEVIAPIPDRIVITHQPDPEGEPQW